MRCLVGVLVVLLVNDALSIFNIRGRYSSWKFCKQLEKIPIYYLKDNDGKIIKNVYNTLTGGIIKSNLWSPNKYRDPNECIEWDVTMDSIPASIIPLFIEEELAKTYANNLGRGSYVVKASLSDYLKWSEGNKSDSCILIPDRESLDLCTKNSTFTGTPIFITNPPIRVSIRGRMRGYAFFISPGRALEILNKITNTKCIKIDEKILSLEFYPNINDRIKSFLGFTKFNLNGFDSKYFTRVNDKIYAIGIETLHSLLFNYPELDNKVVVIT